METTRRVIVAIMSLTLLSAIGVGFANFDFVGPLFYVLFFALSYSALKRRTEWTCHLGIGVGSLATFLTIVIGTYLLDRVDIRKFFPFPVALSTAACLALLGCALNGTLLGFAAGIFGAMLDRRLHEGERLQAMVDRRSGAELMEAPQRELEPGPGPEATEYIRSLIALVADRNPLAVLSELIGALTAYVANVPEAHLVQPEAPGKWSIAQVTAHLADAELVYGYRLRMALTTETPRFEDFDQEGWVERLSNGSVTESLRQLEALRRVNLDLLSQLSEDDLERTGIHSKRGKESIGQMLHLWAGHDLVHLRQIGRIKRSLRLNEE